MPIPDDAKLAALRSWYAGVGACDAVSRYLGNRKVVEASPRGALRRIRRQAVAFAERHHYPDLATVFIARPDRESIETVTRAIEALRLLPLPKPNMTDRSACGCRRALPRHSKPYYRRLGTPIPSLFARNLVLPLDARRMTGK
jgi:hypothetical protein